MLCTHLSSILTSAAVAEWYRYRIVACLVTSSSPVPLKTRRVGQRCALNLSRAETSSRWWGVVCLFLRHGCTLNSLRATNPLARLVEEERWVATDHLQGVLPQNWGGNELNLKRAMVYSVQSPKFQDRRLESNGTMCSESHPNDTPRISVGVSCLWVEWCFLTTIGYQRDIVQFFGFLCISSLLAMICNILVESPFLSLEKIFFKTGDEKKDTVEDANGTSDGLNGIKMNMKIDTARRENGSNNPAFVSNL
ncbi:histone-lysine N-methyltransferase SETMAR [Trichonephila clavipes]|nr:histone-lysine N-methyltransferase SETMAR [Trichonephila clavipes]